MFANNNYAKVWKIFPKEKKDQRFTDVQLSTSRKDRKTGQYTTDFSDYVRMIGDAEEKAAELEAMDRIKLTKVGVSNSFNKEQQKRYYQFICFDFDFDNEQKKANSSSGNSDDVFMELPEDTKLPFDD